MNTPPSTGETKDLIVKEMEFIQSVITRMATNSFQLKGWLIGILSFIMASTKRPFLPIAQVMHWYWQCQY